jgi:hypothetical protein
VFRGDLRMAGGLLFVSQALLDTWAEQGRIDFSGNVMTLLSGEGKGRSYALEPAVRFLKVVGADDDPHQLLAKVKPLAQLREMGAEAVSDSVVLGEVAYEAEPGFLAEVAAVQAAVSAPRAEAAGSPEGPAEPRVAGPARDAEERRREAEALARFLLENLR